MDADYNPQPWQVPDLDDPTQPKRRLGLNLPQLLPPLSTAPTPPSAAPAPPLAESTPSRSLALTPPQPQPLADAPLNSLLTDAVTRPQPQPTAQPSRAEQLREQGPPKPGGVKGFFDSLARSFPLGLAIESSIPGSPGAYSRQLAGAEREEKGSLDREATRSEIGLRDAQTDKLRRGTPDKPDSLNAQEAQAVEELVQGGMSRVDAIGKVKAAGQKPPVDKPDTATENKQAFQSVVGKVDAAKLPTDPKSLPQSLDAALKQGKITPEEHQAASGYLAANPTPSTTIQVQTAGKETAQDIKDANTYYRWTDPTTGKVTTGKGGKVPKGADAEPIGSDKDYATHLREGQAANIVQQSLNRVAQDIDEHPELFDNATARNIMATSLEQIDRASAGILVAGTGGSIPLPSGMGDMINTALQNKALDDKTAAALKQYIADYKAMKDKGIVQQMEMQGGKIGRGSQQVFAAIIDQIPNGKTADSTTAKRQITNMQQTQDRLMKQYRDDGKEQPYKFKSGDAGGTGEMEYGTWKGQRVQRPKGGNGPWAIAPPQ